MIVTVRTFIYKQIKSLRIFFADMSGIIHGDMCYAISSLILGFIMADIQCSNRRFNPG